MTPRIIRAALALVAASLFSTSAQAQAPSFSTYCFGDGSGTACPCGNVSPSATGCANSTGEGAWLFGLIGADSLLFTSQGLPPNTPTLLFRGTSPLSSVTFGDGLRCVGGAIERKGVVTATSGGTAFFDLHPEPLGNEVRYYQLWYRDSSASAPCGSGFNLSSAVKADLTP